jgi:hypothetical protein
MKNTIFTARNTAAVRRKAIAALTKKCPMAFMIPHSLAGRFVVAA